VQQGLVREGVQRHARGPEARGEAREVGGRGRARRRRRGALACGGCRRGRRHARHPQRARARRLLHKLQRRGLGQQPRRERRGLASRAAIATEAQEAGCHCRQRASLLGWHSGRGAATAGRVQARARRRQQQLGATQHLRHRQLDRLDYVRIPAETNMRVRLRQGSDPQPTER
jgi:hypothetical protein